MPSDIDPTSGDTGRTLPFHPVWIAATLAALALAWWVFRPERANPLPRDEQRGGVLAAPPANASFEFYEGELEGSSSDSALPAAPRTATKSAQPVPAGPPAPAQPRDVRGPDANLPRDVVALPPRVDRDSLAYDCAQRPGRRPPPPHAHTAETGRAGPPHGPNGAHPHVEDHGRPHVHGPDHVHEHDDDHHAPPRPVLFVP